MIGEITDNKRMKIYTLRGYSYRKEVLGSSYLQVARKRICHGYIRSIRFALPKRASLRGAERSP
jgi:hypothetical protein